MNNDKNDFFLHSNEVNHIIMQKNGERSYPHCATSGKRKKA